MATKLYFRNTISDYATGNNDANLRSSAVAWESFALSLTAGTGTTSQSTSTVAGTTPGVESGTSSNPFVWYSPPLDADITISGSVTWNLWAAESDMSANVAINGRLEVIDGATGTITLIDQTARVTEVAVTTAAVNNFAETPGAGIACKRGDRLRVRVFGDDVGTMASGFTFTFNYNNTVAGLADSWLQLTENLTFVSEPAGTTIYPTDTASAVSTASVDREAWTSRGAGVQTDVRNTAAGFTTPLQVTDTAGGTVVDWFTKQLTAFTLGGAVRVNVRALNSSTLTFATMKCEIARVAADGTSPTVWALGQPYITNGPTASEVAYSFLISGDDLAISDGQRLRLRFYIDDSGRVGMITGRSATLYYAGTSGGASGDTYLTFSQTLTEYSAAQTVTPTTAALVITRNIPTVTASNHQSVTPTTKALTSALFAPTVRTPILATPAAVSLTVTRFAPTVTATANERVTPTTKALGLTAFAPTVTGAANVTVTPTTASLTATKYAPAITPSDNQRVTPTTAALAATKYVPAVSIDAYSAAVRADGPTVYLRFGEPSGLIGKDEIGNAYADLYNTPTLGATGLVPSNANTAFTFTRASSEYAYVDTRMPAGSSVGVTVEAWVKFATLTAATIYPVGRWFQVSPVAESQFYYHVSGNALRYLYQDATGFRNTFSDAWTPTVGTTYHLVVTHDHSAEIVKFYVNGALLSSEDVSAFGVPVVHGANTWMTFARAGSDYFDGTLDEVAVYNGVLSGARVLAHYNAGIGPQRVTPTTRALVLAAFAPVVTATNAQLVTPTTAALLLTKYAPTVTAGASVAVIPGTAAVNLTMYAPTVTAAQHVTVVPNAVSLITSPQVPTATASDHQRVTPTTASLVATKFAPAARTPALVTPTTKSLALTKFAPTVATPQTVTAGLKTLSTATFAPTITNPQTYVPTTAVLVTTKYAPTVDVTAASTIVVPNKSLTITRHIPVVSATAHLTVTPPAVTLTVTKFAPTVSTTNHQVVIPAVKSLTATTYAPQVSASSSQAFVPAKATLTLTRYAPAVSTTAHIAVIPGTKVLALNRFAPAVRVANLVRPATQALVLTTLAPIVTPTLNTLIRPNPNVLTITEYGPLIEISGHAAFTPQTATLLTTTYPPTAEQHSITPLGDFVYGFAVVAMGDSAGVEGQNGSATVRSEGGGTTVSTSGPSARVTVR